MATWREFLTQIREQVIANKADSGWIPFPTDPDTCVYAAWAGDCEEDILDAVIAKERNKDFVYYSLTLVNTKNSVKLVFATAEDAKLTHKLMLMLRGRRLIRPLLLSISELSRSSRLQT